MDKPKKIETKKTKNIKILSAPLFNQNGEKSGDLKLNPEIFGVKINEVLMTQAVRVYLANQRKGSASTKTRGEVSGGGIKPHKQKGLGKARAGSIRMPQWRGGGVVHGPKPKSFDLSLPKKMKRRALLSALSSKAKDNKVVIVEEIKYKEPKTKTAVKLLSKLPTRKKNLFLVEGKDINVQKSLRNLSGVNVKVIQNLTTYEILNENVLIITKNVLAKMEELYLKGEENGN